MKFEKTKVYNFDGAIRGARNPMESWDKSDSTFDIPPQGRTILGKNDLRLMQRLIKAAVHDRHESHNKFLRQILVCVDITAPLYWWKEFDTYKVGTVANSTSTMHKIASQPITLDCFEIDDYEKYLKCLETYDSDIEVDYSTVDFEAHKVINFLENLRQKYIKTKDKRYWKELIRWLPESWLQKRTITMNYENIRNMYFQRRNHKLTEWSEQFVAWVESLPYAKELIMYEGDDNE